MEFSQDARYGWRMITKNPGFSLIVVLTLALGIGANTTIFTLVNSLILRPLPYPQPDQLMVLNETSSKMQGMSVAYLNFLDWREQNTVFSSLAATRNTDYNLTGKERPEQVNAVQTSASLFEIFGEEPLIGRTYTAEEDEPGAGKVVVLSYALWSNRFGSENEVVGRSITLDGESYNIVGVMKPAFDFAFSSTPPDLWVPIGLNADRWTNRGSHPGITVLGRLNDGVTADAARAQMETISRRLEEAYPDSNTGNGVRIRSLHDVAVRSISAPLFILLTAVGFVLLIACVNVANLLIAKATSRGSEFAVRTALGASRGRVVRQLLTESVILAILGGILGVVFGIAGTKGLLTLIPDYIPRLDEVAMDFRVMLFTGAICLFTGVLFGLAPAFVVTTTNLNEKLKESGRTGAGRGRHHLRRLLIVSEVALAIVLLVGATLLMRSFRNVVEADPGFDAVNVLTVRFSMPERDYPEDEQQVQFVRNLLTGVSSLPGVECAGVATPILGSWQTSIWVEGTPPPKPGDSPLVDIGRVSPDYLKTMGIRLQKGRYFNEHDHHESAPVTIVDEVLVERFWPDEDPIGKRLKFGGPDDVDDPWFEVVGVANHVKNYGVDQDSRIELYLPYYREPVRSTTLVLRTASDPRGLVGAVTDEVQRLDATLPVFDVLTMEEYLGEEVAPRRLMSYLTGVFAFSALLLAAIGLYGLLSYSVAQRHQEIGIRMALGAPQASVLRNVISEGVRLATIGLLAGLGLAAGLTRYLESQLFGVTAYDLTSYATVVVLLVAVALFSTYFPARRAAAVDPNVALRYE
jgi:putative ABC transport system permease protein